MVTNEYHGDDYLILRDTGRWTQHACVIAGTVSRLSNQPEDTQESHELIPNPPPSSSATCQHH